MPDNDDCLRHVRWRSGLIESADRTVADCERFLKEAASSPGPERAERLTQRCAKLFCAAAGLYKSAGLGLRAKAEWTRAAECYDAVGLPEKGDRCRRDAAAIPSYTEHS
jgi:hypothetical protein